MLNVEMLAAGHGDALLVEYGEPVRQDSHRRWALKCTSTPRPWRQAR